MPLLYFCTFVFTLLYLSVFVRFCVFHRFFLFLLFWFLYRCLIDRSINSIHRRMNTVCVSVRVTVSVCLLFCFSICSLSVYIPFFVPELVLWAVFFPRIDFSENVRCIFRHQSSAPAPKIPTPTTCVSCQKRDSFGRQREWDREKDTLGPWTFFLQPTIDMPHLFTCIAWALSRLS